MKRLIVTADDFGLDEAVNEAVERAHREGILSTASLMVGEAAAADAVRRAVALPSLKVGLHLVLFDGTPVLPPDKIPDLVDRDGRFPRAMVKQSLRFFADPKVRHQLAAEIKAQFEAFARTGLALDHVNGHKHAHLHPTVAGLVFRIGREFGLRAIRLPREPALPGLRRGLSGALLALWCRQLGQAARRRGIATNDYLLGLAWTGGLTEARLLSVIGHLPDGVGELYSHPAVVRSAQLQALMPDYRHDREFAALISPAVAEACRRAGIVPTSFGDLAGGAAA